eukprot:COSAG04_NODE_19135_length_424_cov_0.353846_1_plen_138_part_10
MRGLGVLRDLERVVLDKVVESEVSTVSLVMEMGANGDRSNGERTAGGMSAFVLFFRNCSSAEVRRCFIDESWVDSFTQMLESLYDGRLDELEGLSVFCSLEGVLSCFADLVCKSAVAERGPLEKSVMKAYSIMSKYHC